MKKKSILIITYGREIELYETLKCISKYRKNDLELLILDNNLESYRKDEIDKIFINSPIALKYYYEGKNYGVALGRNYLIERATGEILITLDDDIEIEDISILIEKIENKFQNDKSIGCLAFNIKNYYTRKALNHEIPHGNKKLDFTKDLETYYFIGAGHAVKKEVYLHAGLYPNDLGMYGGEEEDLSYRIIDKYKIIYCHDIIIFHKVSPNGRMPKEDELYLRYRNKLKVRIGYLPKKYAISNFIVWTIFYLIKSKFKISDVLKFLKENKNNKSQRRKLKEKNIKKLKKLKARLLY